MKKLINRKELCEATNGKLTMWTIGELTRRGDIPVIRVPGMRVYLYDYDAVMAWLSGLQQETTVPGLRLAK
jgi:hypothetical protein